MARIFSIRFSYEGVEHHAMVSVRTTPFFSEYTVAMLNESIADQLPNNKILAIGKNNLSFSDSARENEPALMKAIIQEVAAHLHAVNV